MRHRGLREGDTGDLACLNVLEPRHDAKLEVEKADCTVLAPAHHVAIHDSVQQVDGGLVHQPAWVGAVELKYLMHEQKMCVCVCVYVCVCVVCVCVFVTLKS